MKAPRIDARGHGTTPCDPRLGRLWPSHDTGGPSWVPGAWVVGIASIACVVLTGCGGRAEEPAGAHAEASDPRASEAVAPAAHTADATVRFGAGSESRVVDLSARSEGRVELEVFEPYEERTVRFSALPALPLLDELLPSSWRSADELVFECADGYRAAVPVSRFVAHQAFFATARVGADFAIDKSVGGAVVHTALAPVYLVWENQRDELVRSEGDWGWPYQVVGVTVAEDATGRYARMAPPDDAGPSAVRGFAVFRRYCARCHAMNGEGGEVGPELNYPASVSEYLDPSWLRRWIDAPLSVRRGTPMPGLPQGIPARQEALDDVIAYLNAMARRKLAPEGEPPASATLDTTPPAESPTPATSGATPPMETP